MSLTQLIYVITRQGCALGLLNIQQYYGLAPAQLAQGQIEDLATGQNFFAATRLTHQDALLVAQVAVLLLLSDICIYPVISGGQSTEAPGRRDLLAGRLPAAGQEALSRSEGARQAAREA